MTRKIVMLACLSGIIATASCSDKTKHKVENPVVQEPELITTVTVKTTQIKPPYLVRYFMYRVINGTGSNHTEFHADRITLNANTDYDIEVLLSDETKTPAADVTQEIITERNAHLFYYISEPVDGGGSISVSERDTDDHGQPFGRICKWHTGDVGSGKLILELIHGPRNKLADERSKIAGSTDVEATFEVILK